MISVHYARGALADRRDDLEGAIAEFQRATELARREYGVDHFLTATTQAALASLLGAVGRVEEALASHMAALDGLERWVGPTSSELVRPLMNLALTESSAGLHAEAEQHARRALAISERTDNPDRLGTALRNLGVVLTNMGRGRDAVPLYERAAAVLEAGDRPSAAASARVQRVLAATPDLVASRDRAAIARARVELDESRAKLAAVFGPDALEVADADAALANLLAELGRCHDARIPLTRALASFERAKAPPDRRVLLNRTRSRCEIGP